MTTTIYYDSRWHEIVIRWKLNFAENYAEKYPLHDILQVSMPFQHAGGWTFKLTLRTRGRAPKAAGKVPKKFVLHPMTHEQCFKLFHQITDDHAKLMTRMIN